MDATVTLAENSRLLPMDLGPLNPTTVDIFVGLVFFGLTFLVLAKVLLPRINKVLTEREDATEGGSERAEALREEAAAVHAQYEAELAAARHEAARIRAKAQEEGAAAIAAAREEGVRERERIIAEGTAAIKAERTAAEEGLSANVDAWARTLAGRILGEPVASGAPARD
ncbi:hypothetical protein NX801_20505 [Streptomyces sp. LP05-1]|uniref:ATP synthase subunit b n=1 Tax=Streptomyces pyxinae TaxID=2970734 RepID=A0ABT2CKP6_9ACTN|nr:hypothetical protein [Streptomyces sp. LP05-1]MCS0637993.1 hypothetical protein [Streptomyces sp. LP05-1]